MALVQRTQCLVHDLTINNDEQVLPVTDRPFIFIRPVY
jgi:hypothetical protein